MQATEELWKAYHDWKELTEQEALAIQRARWDDVHRAQEQKRALQSEILQLTERAQAGLNSSSAELEFNARLRTIVNELILLETQNNAGLQAAKDTTQCELRALDATGNRLRRVQTSYVPAFGPFWQNEG